jgi:Domain of unknown function (DUF4259)
MGAWNPGNFSNDTALDFVSEIASMDDLKRPIDAIVSGLPDYIDADLACEALAAADLLAGMLGRPATDLPEETPDLLSNFGEPSADMLTLARTAAARIVAASELADLWNEEEGQAWNAVVDDLMQRLDPATPYESQISEIPVEGGFICSICEGVIPESDMKTVEIGFPNMPEFTMGTYFHGSCLEAKFEPPYFSSEGSVEDALKTQIERFLFSEDNNSKGA